MATPCRLAQAQLSWNPDKVRESSHVLLHGVPSHHDGVSCDRHDLDWCLIEHRALE
jgi:hypothetical protein